MKTEIKPHRKLFAYWWSWIATCDICNKKIHGHEIHHSAKPNTQEKDYCINCMRFFLDKNIPEK